MKLGHETVLCILREKPFGVFLGIEGKPEEGEVLLPRNEVPEGKGVGSEVKVFLYKDSKDRPIATTLRPFLLPGELRPLKVVDVNRNGAFLEWGLPKDLFLPYKEQPYPVKKGDRVLVALYEDKSGRLCATGRVYARLSADSPYKRDDTVNATVYRINPDMGAFLAVENQYFGFVPKQELHKELTLGESVEARVVRVRTDGKLDLSLQKKAYLQRESDAETILTWLLRNKGRIPYGEKAPKERIEADFHMSRNAFKRALGTLLWEGKIEIRPDEILRKED